jgi:hypothetical protein
VDTTANQGDRADPRTIKRAAREAAHQAGAAASGEVQNLIADVEDLLNRVGDAADPEVRRLRSKVVSQALPWAFWCRVARRSRQP